MNAARPSVFQIRDQGSPNVVGQRQATLVTGLTDADHHVPFDPIDVVESQLGNFICSEAEACQDQENGVVAPSQGGSVGAELEHTRYFRLAQMAG